jgi:hypothetical protein
MKLKRLTPLKSIDSNNKKVFGFDIETYGDENKFLMGSLYSEDIKDKDGKPYIFVFWDKHSFFEEIKTNKFRNSYIVATNLAFDFFGVFFNNIEISNFRFSFRGGQLIGMKTYITQDKKFCASSYYYNEKTNKKIINKICIRFIDTINYVFYGVKKLGQIIGINKLPSPECLGKIPNNEKERAELIIYNIRDSEISYKFIRFLFDSFEQIGTKSKMTIASTSLNLFRCKYLNQSFNIHSKEILIDLLNAYYGGRTEAFRQGLFYNYNYYDFCSLYPMCMLNAVPNPNTLRIATKFNNLELIKMYDGVSKVRIKTTKYLRFPLLPVRTKEKLLFPLGEFTGYYTHIELRKALELGYKILDVDKTYYYTQNVKIFNHFVQDIYKKRREMKILGNPIQLVYKILLNSLSGKFAQKFTNDVIQPFNFEISDLENLSDFERIQNYIRYTEESEPSNFNCVIWSVYITAYARLMLYSAMIKLNPIYVDTDSLITKQTIQSGFKLGDLELEYKIKKGFIVKPKFYAFVTDDGKEISKIKGVSEYLNFNEFFKRVNTNKPYSEFSYIKFCKFKEAIRRGLKPNQKMEIKKELLKEDTKRNFTKLRYDRLNDSTPITFYSDTRFKNE